MDKEIWKDIDGYEGLYQVSNFGKVKRVNYRNTKQVRNIKIQKTVHGYNRIALWKCGKSKKFFVHRLVAKAFIPNCDNLPQVNHINGIKTDNRVQNLEWLTVQQNIKHAYETKLRKGFSGERNARAKLTNEQVAQIRHEYIPRDKSNNMYVLAKKYGVSPSKISDIIHNKSYKE